MKIFFGATLIFLSLTFFSCASNRGRNAADFYEENIALFAEFSLSNGIPVVLKNVPSEKNIEVRLLFEGGASTCPRGKSGLDFLTFEVLSQSPAVKELSSHGKYFSVALCANDFSTYGFSSAVADFDEAFAAFAKSILQPDFSHEDYLEKESEAENAALDRSENLHFALLDAIAENLLRSHPYYDGIFYKSTSRVSEYDIEENLKNLLDARRIKIVAAGNFSALQYGEKKSKVSQEDSFSKNAARIGEMLEEFFGAILPGEFSAPQIPAINFANKKDEKKEFEFAGNYYCAALCQNAPERGADDYEAFALASLAADYILRRELVQKNAATSCGTAVLNGKQSVALIVANGINEDHDIKEIIASALEKNLSAEEFAPLLNAFKNIYASKIYASEKNCFATLEQIASSIFYEGNASEYLNRIEKIEKLTVEEVRAAYEKYFLGEGKFFVEVKK
ncbi:MAG: hypothetical protein K2I95_11020 [Treponemataceae bacterium]|nr:hypothetical protein [Treponemataceae bacterium]